MQGRQLPREIEEALRQFADNVCGELGSGTVVYLFGSFARGDWLVDSDIDLIVISPRLRGVDWYQRYPRLRRLAPMNVSLEILAYTPEEFEEVSKRSIVIQDAMRYWVKVVECR